MSNNRILMLRNSHNILLNDVLQEVEHPHFFVTAPHPRALPYTQPSLTRILMLRLAMRLQVTTHNLQPPAFY